MWKMLPVQSVIAWERVCVFNYLLLTAATLSMKKQIRKARRLF